MGLPGLDLLIVFLYYLGSLLFNHSTNDFWFLRNLENIVVLDLLNEISDGFEILSINTLCIRNGDIKMHQ